MSKYWVLVGSFNPLITTVQFTPSPPSLALVSQFQSGSSPTWLVQSPGDPTTIYATDEVSTGGSINSLVLDRNTGGLTHAASVPTQGGSPTHLGLINQGAALALGAANYGTGSAFIVNLDPTATGQFSRNGTVVAFSGSGPLPNQASPHAHQVSRDRILVRIPSCGLADWILYV
jgi:6-phosphogluconolactonase (cycloisomerase 2 family)